MNNKKIDKLNDEQKSLMKVVRDEWINQLDSCPTINREDVIAGVDWMYGAAKLNKPEVIFIKSPLGAQYCANVVKKMTTDKNVWNSVSSSVRTSVWSSVEDSVKDSVGGSVSNAVRDSVSNSVDGSVVDSVSSSVWNSVENSVRNSVRGAVGDAVWNSVEASVADAVVDSVRDAVGDAVWDAVGDAVGDALKDSVMGSVRNSKFEMFDWAARGSIWDYGWISFYDYFERIGVKYQCDFGKLLRFAKSGVYDMIQLKGLCIVIEMPTELHRETPLNGRLHCTTGPAIKFGDGYELYYLWGVRFEKGMYEKIINKKLTPQEIITIPNIEHRMCAMKFYGDELDIPDDSCRFLKEEGGYRLFSIQLNPNIEETDYFLKYSCPSTGRKYLSFVDPNIGKNKDPIECIASKFKLTRDQWLKIEQHT